MALSPVKFGSYEPVLSSNERVELTVCSQSSAAEGVTVSTPIHPTVASVSKNSVQAKVQLQSAGMQPKSILHVSRQSRHAASNLANVIAPQASLPSAAISWAPGPSVPTPGPVVCGPATGPRPSSANRPAMHGIQPAMQTPTSIGRMSSVPHGKNAPPVLQTYTHEQVVAFGGISDEASRGLRSSGRLRSQPNADATQLDRAMALAQKRDELSAQGMKKPQPVSILSFSDAQIIDTASSLGVSLGSSHSERVVSAKIIKNYELMRTLTILEKKVEPSSSLAESVPHCLVVSRASNLSEDLEDEENLEEDNRCMIPPVVQKERKPRKKKSYDMKNVRKSNRIRIKNSKL